MTSITPVPSSINSFEGETCTITVAATPGVTDLEIRVLSADESAVVHSGLTLTETGGGIYTTTWNGRDANDAIVIAGDYVLRVFNLATTTYIGFSESFTIRGIGMILPSSDAFFAPTGTNVVSFSLETTPGQTGLNLRFYSISFPGNDYWRDSSGNSNLPLSETATPGIYTATWDGIYEYAYYGGPFIALNGTYTVYVVDADGNQSTTTGEITIDSVASVSRTPDKFTASDGQTTEITVSAVTGLNLEIKIAQNISGVWQTIRTLSMIGSDTTYTATWDGKNDAGEIVPTGTYYIYVYHTGTPVRYYRTSSVQVTPGVTSISASVNPFIPTGTNTATITVESAPGQTGLSLRFYSGLFSHSWWRDSSGNIDKPLTETAAPGVYTATWDGIYEYEYYGGPYIARDGTYSIYVVDAEGNQSTTTGEITIDSVASVSRTPDKFTASDGQTTEITVSAVTGLNLEIKIAQNISGVWQTIRTLSMIGSDTTYTATWDGKNDAGEIVPTGTYYIYVYHTGTPVRYYRTSSVQVTPGVTSISASVNPFIPTGTNTATITVESAPGQTGLSLRFYSGLFSHSWWRDSSGNIDKPLTETAAPGVYTATWDGIYEYEYYGGPFIALNGTYTVYVVDADGNQSTTTGQITISGVASVSRNPSPFTPGGNNYASITANAATGINLEARIFNSTTQVLTKSIPMTEVSGAYSAEWDGRDTFNNFAGANTYYIRIFHAGSDVRYYRTTSIVVNVAVFAISASPAPFVPTGSNLVTITVLADPGQSGLKATVTHPISGTSPQLLLKEVGSEGTYTTTWDGKINSVIPDDEICTIRVYDASNNQFPSTGTLTISSVSPLTVTPNPLEVTEGATAAIRVEMPEGLNLEVRIGSVRTISLTASGTEYTGTWDGKDGSGSFVPAGTYIVSLWNSSTNTRYDIQTILEVTLDDTVSPETTITSGPAPESYIQSGDVVFNWSGTDNMPGDLTYSYKLDGDAWSGFDPATTHTFTSLAEGLHTFSVKAKDPAGNEDQTPATRNFTIDDTPPGPPSGFRVTAAQTEMRFDCQIDFLCLTHT